MASTLDWSKFGDGGEIVTGNPADAFVSHRPQEGIADQPLRGQQVFHEHIGVEVAPGDTAAFDIALDQLVPDEVRIGFAAVAEDAEVDDERHPGIGCGIGDALHLMHHFYGVGGEYEHPVDARERGGEAARVREVEQHGCLAVGLPCRNLFGPARRAHNFDTRIIVEQCSDRTASNTGCAEDEDAGLGHAAVPAWRRGGQFEMATVWRKNCRSSMLSSTKLAASPVVIV